MNESKFEGMALGVAEGADTKPIEEGLFIALLALFLSMGNAPNPEIQKMKEDMAEMRGKMSVIEKMIGGK